jgi:hypothetical protein
MAVDTMSTIDSLIRDVYCFLTGVKNPPCSNVLFFHNLPRTECPHALKLLEVRTLMLEFSNQMVSALFVLQALVNDYNADVKRGGEAQTEKDYIKTVRMGYEGYKEEYTQIQRLLAGEYSEALVDRLIAFLQHKLRLVVDPAAEELLYEPVTLAEAALDVETCEHCGVGGRLKACSVCNVKYCSRECQVAAWKTHKVVCGVLID